MFSQADVWMCDKAAKYLDKILVSLKKEFYISNLNKKSYTCTFDLMERSDHIINVRMTISPSYETFGDIELKFYYNGEQQIINGNLKFIFKNYATLMLKLSVLFPESIINVQNTRPACTLQHYVSAV